MPGKLSRRDFIKAAVSATGTVALTAAIPGLAAPARQASGETKKLIFSSYTFSGYENAVNQVIDKWIATQPSGSVEVERQFAPWDDYWGKVQTQIAGGTPPDLGLADGSRLVSYAKSGIILNISDRVAQSNFPIDQYFPSALAWYRWKEGDFDSGNPDGDLYGLPADAQSMVFYYNRKMFDEAGVAYPTDDWTWDDLLAAAKALTKDDQSQYGFYMAPAITWRGIWVKAAGGAFHTPDFKQSLFNSPETKEAMTWLWDLIYTHKVSPPPMPSGAPNPFLTRQVAMTIDGVWWLTDFGNGLGADEWDVAMFPKHPKTGKRTTTVESDGWWIFKDSKEPELAWSLLQFIASQGGQKQLSDLGFFIPSCIPDLAAEYYAQKPPEHRSKILDNITQDSVKSDVTYFDVTPIQSVVDPIIAAAFADGSDIGQALEQADQAMNAELARAWTEFNK